MGLPARYASLLPLNGATPKVNPEEGSTPLIPLPRIGDRLGVMTAGGVS